MQNPVAMFNQQQPVLPLTGLLGQQPARTIALLPIGTKIKSFKIEHQNSDNSPPARRLNIDLPNFADLRSYSDSNSNQTVFPLQITESQCSLRTVKRFWWHWLLSTSKKLSFLVLLILFQSSSQATNLLEKVRIYIDLNSYEAVTLPTNSKIYLSNSQASPFNRAIKQASEIEVNSPFYAEAQENVNRWSRIILDIAQGRAERGDFAGAIAAVELIPQHSPATALITQEATKAVHEWQRIVKEQNLYQDFLTEAKTSIDPNLASSYNQGIGILQQIAPGAKEYLEAQNLIRHWNRQIYLIVQNRIEQGNFKQAVEAAVLISHDSIYYQLAKDEIEIKIKSIYAQYAD